MDENQVATNLSGRDDTKIYIFQARAVDKLPDISSIELDSAA